MIARLERGLSFAEASGGPELDILEDEALLQSCSCSTSETPGITKQVSLLKNRFVEISMSP